MRLPPWSGDDEAMYLWCVAMLEAQMEIEIDAMGKRQNMAGGDEVIVAAGLRWLQSDGPAIELARGGDVTLLRERYPKLVEFLHAPTNPPG